MKRKGVKMVFKPNEFKYFLFNKKICPHCKEKLKRIVKKEYVGKEATVMSSPLDMYELKNYYYCDFCKQEYSLTELSERRKNK